MAGRQIAKPPLFLVRPYAPRGTVAVVIGTLTRNRTSETHSLEHRPRDLLNARSIEQASSSSLRAHHPAARPRIGLHGAPVSFDARLHLQNARSILQVAKPLNARCTIENLLNAASILQVRTSSAFARATAAPRTPSANATRSATFLGHAAHDSSEIKP